MGKKIAVKTKKLKVEECSKDRVARTIPALLRLYYSPSTTYDLLNSNKNPTRTLLQTRTSSGMGDGSFRFVNKRTT
jgi:hypothetical protein